MEAEHRFTWHLCKMFGVLPNDPKITEMDSVTKMWIYENWLEDQNQQVELVKNHAYLLASFDHSEAVQKMIGNAGTTHKLSDEEFDESLELVKNFRKPQEKSNKRKRKFNKD